jgi:DNA-directed RNA polymerase III subunit RPC2
MARKLQQFSTPRSLLTIKWLRFDRLADAPLDDNGKIQKKYDIIQMDGLAGVGERVDPGDIYINKQTPTNANDNAFTGQAASVPYKNAPMTYKSPIAGNIDKVMVTDTDNDQTLIKVLIRQTRRPELGDKFSSRHGQKGVCGLIVNQEDMPFNDQGVVPGEWRCLHRNMGLIHIADSIMNPHGFPSRMTVGKMIELLAGKVHQVRLGHASQSDPHLRQVCCPESCNMAQLLVVQR